MGSLIHDYTPATDEERNDKAVGDEHALKVEVDRVRSDLKFGLSEDDAVERLQEFSHTTSSHPPYVRSIFHSADVGDPVWQTKIDRVAARI